MTEQMSAIRIMALEKHQQQMRDNPKYREEWERIEAVFCTMLADVELQDEDDKP